MMKSILFTPEEGKTKRYQVICSKSHTQLVRTELGFEPGRLIPIIKKQ